MKKIFQTGSLTIVFLFSSLMAISQDFPPWPAPDEANTVENPINSDIDSMEAGKSIFDLQCKACHGNRARGDGLIKSADLGSETYLAQPDGAVFWKLKEGRGQMPSFMAFSDDQLWNVINYVKGLSEMPDAKDMKNALISVYFDENSEQKKLVAKVEEFIEDGTKVPVSNIRVNFGVQRYFGILPVSETVVYSNDNGEALIIFPDTFIGNENGELTVVASVENMEYNPVEVRTEIAWGKYNPGDYWTERRTLWKNNDYVPIWLLITFIGGALAIWGTIFYVALLVRKIKIEGDNFK